MSIQDIQKTNRRCHNTRRLLSSPNAKTGCLESIYTQAINTPTDFQGLITIKHIAAANCHKSTFMDSLIKKQTKHKNKPPEE